MIYWAHPNTDKHVACIGAPLRRAYTAQSEGDLVLVLEIPWGELDAPHFPVIVPPTITHLRLLGVD